MATLRLYQIPVTRRDKQKFNYIQGDAVQRVIILIFSLADIDIVIDFAIWSWYYEN